MIMVEFLNYLQGKDKMIREFKFFHGITIESEGIRGIIRTLRAQWAPEDLSNMIDAEAELTRLMSEQIANEIDNEMIRIITRNFNGGNRA